MADHFLADALAAVRRTLALAAEPTDDARLLARFARDRRGQPRFLLAGRRR